MLLHYVVTITTVSLCMTLGIDAERDGLDFTHEWVVRVLGGEQHAREVASDTGFTFDRQVRQLSKYKQNILLCYNSKKIYIS